MNNMTFQFRLPTNILFGNGIASALPDEIRAMKKHRIMIITDQGLIKAGIIDQILAFFSPEERNAVCIFDEVEPNPRDTTVEKAVTLGREMDAQVLVAIGGGSSMDVAKAASVLLVSGGKVQDYEGLDRIKEEPLPLIAIPTTVGTGSEVTFWSVITDTRRHFKMSLGSHLIAPRIALVDPDLVASLPPAMVASTGMDALTHAIEGYTCLLAEPITDACGIYAISLISQNIRDAVYTDSKEARSNMLLGSLIAGICFGNSDIAGVHCMAEALGGLYDTPHGLANAVMLPYVMEYNYVSNMEKFAQIAQAMGEKTDGLSVRDGAFQSVAAVRKLNQDLEIPTLAELGAREEDLDELAQRSLANVSVNSNPRKTEKQDFLRIFKKALAQ